MIPITGHQVDTRITVETPEGVDFQFTLAGPGRRLTAFLADLLIRIAIAGFLLFVWYLLSQITRAAREPGAGVLLLGWFAAHWVYHSLFESLWNGQTPGKRLQQLRVVRTNGTPVSPLSAIGRNFLRAADCQPAFFLGLYTVGLISMLCTRRLQRLGDIVFDTMVIDESRDTIHRTQGITVGVEPLLRSECVGRFHVPERTLAVIERLFEENRLMSESRREEICMPLSMALRSRLGYQEPAPDLTRPQPLLASATWRHTRFLRQVLKTFSDHLPLSVEGVRSPGTLS